MSRDYAEAQKSYAQAQNEYSVAKAKADAYAEAVEQQCIDTRMRTAAYRAKVGAKIAELEQQAANNEQTCTQKVDVILATIPIESTANE